MATIAVTPVGGTFPLQSNILQPQTNKSEAVPYHPVVTYGLRAIGSIAIGAFFGYVGYWITRWQTSSEEMAGHVLRPFPYILAGVLGAAITTTFELTYQLGLYILGDRDKYENLSNSASASAFDRLRQRTWKMTTSIENINHRVDQVFSRIFHIRTLKEIKTQNIGDRELSHIEIIRRAFREQVIDTLFISTVPQQLGIYAVKKMGFTLLGLNMVIVLHAIGFVGGLIQKASAVYEKNQKEEQAEKQKAQQAVDHELTDKVLPLMYPGEFDELGVIEKQLEKLPYSKATASITHLENTIPVEVS